MIDPLTIGVGVLVWLAFKKQSGTQFGVLTPEREELFRNAMAHCKDPKKLATLAGIFHKEGLKAESALLKKRAEWRGRSDSKRKEHQDVFDRAMKSENVQAILGVAAAFEGLTATHKAKLLREHAQAVNEANLKKSAEPAPKTEEKKPVVLEAVK